MMLIAKYFDTGKIEIRNNGLAVDLTITKFSDIIEKIIPFLKKIMY